MIFDFFNFRKHAHSFCLLNHIVLIKIDFLRVAQNILKASKFLRASTFRGKVFVNHQQKGYHSRIPYAVFFSTVRVAEDRARRDSFNISVPDVCIGALGYEEAMQQHESVAGL